MKCPHTSPGKSPAKKRHSATRLTNLSLRTVGSQMFLGPCRFVSIVYNGSGAIFLNVMDIDS